MREISGGGLSYSEEHGIIWEHICEDESDFIFDEIFTKRVYDRHGIVISDGSTIIDIGANIGLFSLFCLQQSKSINILCIEPLPPNFQVLKRNLADHTKKKNERCNIKFEECAVGSSMEHDSLSDFYFFSGNPGESTRHPIEQSNQRKILLNAALNCGIEEIRDIALEQLKSSNIYTAESAPDTEDHHDLNLKKCPHLNRNCSIITIDKQILDDHTGLMNGVSSINNSNWNYNTNSFSSEGSPGTASNTSVDQIKPIFTVESSIGNCKYECKIKSLEMILTEQNILSVDLIKVSINSVLLLSSFSLSLLLSLLSILMSSVPFLFLSSTPD